ncbi:MAG TPA: Rieske 2Fe-2S domain-containing protein [Polyangiaceae bacterium]
MSPDSALTARVAGAAGLRHGQSQAFTFQRGSLPEEGFVLRWGDGLYCFANSCPHWSVDLDYGSGDFFDVALDRIVCKNHGALFHPQTGFCEWGPCTGHSLESFELSVEGDDVVVQLR